MSGVYWEGASKRAPVLALSMYALEQATKGCV